MGRHAREQRVAAAGDQADEGRLEGTGRAVRTGGEEVGRHVALQVVDRREGKAPGGGQGLRGRQAHQQGAHQPGALRGGDELYLRQRRAGLLERRRHEVVDQLEMVP